MKSPATVTGHYGTKSKLNIAMKVKLYNLPPAVLRQVPRKALTY